MIEQIPMKNSVDKYKDCGSDCFNLFGRKNRDMVWRAFVGKQWPNQLGRIFQGYLCKIWHLQWCSRGV